MRSSIVNLRAMGATAAVAAATVVLAVPSARAQPATSDGVVMYGLIDSAVRYMRNEGNRFMGLSNGMFTGSRWGIRGREQIGDGLAAVFTLEAGFDSLTGSSLQGTATANYGQAAGSRLFGRQVHFGLQGKDWGLILGRQYTLAHTLAARFQPQGNPNNQALAVFSNHHIARQDNMLRLNVKLADVEVSATRTFGQQFGSDSANASWAVGAAYSAGPVALAAYVQQMKNLTGSETRKIWGLGGNVRINDTLHLFSGFMRRTHQVSPQSNKAFLVGANVAVSPNVTVSAAHLRDHQSGSAVLSGKRRGSWVSASYRFSKRTDVYVVLDTNKVSGGYSTPAWMPVSGTLNGVATGLRHRF